MKILVRATNWVGDAVMSIPAIAAIRSRWPQAEIAILGRPWVVELYRGQGYADRLIVFDHAGRHRGVVGRERLAAGLRRGRFDVAVLLQNALEAARPGLGRPDGRTPRPSRPRPAASAPPR